MNYIVYVRGNCPFCVKAEELLNIKNLNYKIVNFSDDQTELLSEIKDAYSWPTVPMIFRREKNEIEFIGGYTDLEKILDNE
tara:strand:+ start:224 stop:466 length:243 start_codon:yes stop_codon:yes gene_type:complete